MSDYAILLLTGLARAGDIVTAKGLAETTRVAPPTVVKLLKVMAARGLLHSTQGRNGGYALARPAGEITLADIIEAVDGPIAMTDCNLEHGECDIEQGCATRPHWRSINTVVRGALEGVTLAELTRPRAVPAVWHERRSAAGATD